MDIVVVDGIGKIEFVIVPSVQRGTLIFGGYVCISPLEIRLYIVHPAKIQDSGVGIGRNRYYYTFVNNIMTDHKPFIITIVGPESSGKTTLARKLAAYLGCPWVPEYAREYLEGLGRRYEEADLKEIAAGQLEAISRASDGQLAVGSEQWAVSKRQWAVGSEHSADLSLKGVKVNMELVFGNLQLDQNAVLSFQREAFGAVERPVLILDSGMLSLRMWARVKYGSEIPIVQTALKEDITSMYLLCRPLAIWEPDPLREAPLLLDRAWIYNHYLAELSASLLT